MFHTLTLLNEQNIQKLNSLYDAAEFKAGLMTKVEFVPEIKNNLEMSRGEGYFLESEKIIVSSVSENYDFQEYTALRKYGPILFSQYTAGMYYHKHNDYYKMGSVRTDYSCTVFLSNPDEYSGGELMIDVGNKEIPFKLNAGDAIIYPTGYTHRVNEVTSGVRRACVFWIESTIQNSVLRQINSDMHGIMKNYAVPDNWKEKQPELYENFVKIKFNLLRNFGNFEGMN
jgi:PKHD-type hydroxylase